MYGAKGKMAASTPKTAPQSSQNADFTHPQDPQTPTNLNRAAKRQQKALNHVAPPRLDYGTSSNACTTASKAISSQLEAFEREARIQRDVMHSFGSTVDQFVSAYNNPDERQFAQSICEKVVTYITNSLYAESSNFVPISIKKASNGSSLSSSSKSVTFADLAKTLKNSGANIRPAKHDKPPGSAPTSTSGGVSVRSSASSASFKGPSGAHKVDRRLLVTCEPWTLHNREQPFMLRQALVSKVSGITLASVPLVMPTRTGWAITPSDLTVRDLLSTEENTKHVLSTFKGTGLKRPEVWFNYAIPNVPTSFFAPEGGLVPVDAKLVSEEVAAQTTVEPTNCRPSRHGADPHSGRITWIVSFLAPTRPFRLFNTSELARQIDKKTPISRHTPGCQGFCNPSKCTRYARCSTCSVRIDQHTGLSGEECTGKPRCANCHGPHTADHEHCPAAPRRKNGKLIKPTKKELDTIRKFGDRDFKDAHTARETTTAPSSQLPPQAQGPETDAMTAQRGTKRKGATVTAYEKQSSSTPAGPARTETPNRPKASTQLSSSAPPASAPRPRRSTASGKDLNEAELFNETFGPDEEMDIDSNSSQ